MKHISKRLQPKYTHSHEYVCMNVCVYSDMNTCVQRFCNDVGSLSTLQKLTNDNERVIHWEPFVICVASLILIVHYWPSMNNSSHSNVAILVFLALCTSSLIKSRFHRILYSSEFQAMDNTTWLILNHVC